MSQRRKHHARMPLHSLNPRPDHGPQAPAWPTDHSPAPTNHLTQVSICDDPVVQPAPPAGDGDDSPKSGYANSRGNACKHGMRARVIYPSEIAELINLKTIAFIEQMKPRDEWETFLVSEIARATVLVEVCGQRLVEDEVRVHERVSGDGWNIDAGRRSDRLAARIHRDPQLTVRELERTRHGAEFLLVNFFALGEVVASNQALDDTQRDMLFTLLGVPHELRNGSQRVPSGNNGPALAALIAGQVARLERRIVSTLDGQDRAEQNAALTLGSPYRDKTTRQLRSDEARNLKRLYWATEALAQVRQGTTPESIIDPETKQPINPAAHAAPVAVAKPRPAPAPAPEPAPEPPPASPPEDAPARPASVAPRFAANCTAEDREAILMAGEAVRQLFRQANPAAESSDGTSAEPGSDSAPDSPPPA